MLVSSPRQAQDAFETLRPEAMTWEWVSAIPSSYDPIRKRLIQFESYGIRTRYWVRSHPDLDLLVINPTQFHGAADKHCRHWIRHSGSIPMTGQQQRETLLIRLNLSCYRCLNHFFVPFYFHLGRQIHGPFTCKKV